MLGHKTNLSKFNKIEIILIIFSDHKGMGLEINYKNKTAQQTNKNHKHIEMNQHTT